MGHFPGSFLEIVVVTITALWNMFSHFKGRLVTNNRKDYYTFKSLRIVKKKNDILSKSFRSFYLYKMHTGKWVDLHVGIPIWSLILFFGLYRIFIAQDFSFVWLVFISLLVINILFITSINKG